MPVSSITEALGGYDGRNRSSVALQMRDARESSRGGGFQQTTHNSSRIVSKMRRVSAYTRGEDSFCYRGDRPSLFSCPVIYGINVDSLSNFIASML
jgi:hypothetical protein